MPDSYTVASGDTLSAIAGRFYGNPDLWPALWWVNKSSVSNPDDIRTGQVLKLSQWHTQADWLTVSAMRAIPAPPPPAPPPPPPTPVQVAADPQPAQVAADPQPAAPSAPGGGSYGHPYYCGDGDGDGWDMPCHDAAPASNSDSAPISDQQQEGDSTPRQVSPPKGTYQAVTVSPASYSGFQACVISRESGGNSQVMNSSGHYGLYQFAASTWAAYGGNPATFGHASVAEQNQVFANAMATPGGRQNWSPYDGC